MEELFRYVDDDFEKRWRLWGTKVDPGPLTCKDWMRGDVDFENLVEQHHASLYRFALSLCRTESEAADLVQETFYLWAAKGHQLEDATRVKSWLFTTLHREFLGRRRRSVRFPHHELAEVENELPEVPPELPTHLDWNHLAACLEQMDATFHAPVALFYLEDHSYQEIAQILDVPLGTVKSRIARGIAQLQQLIHLRSQPPATAAISPRSPAQPPSRPFGKS